MQRWGKATYLFGGLLAMFSFWPGGCGRQYYVDRADSEVEEIIAEKSYDPRWEIPEYSVEMDPRSRYYDPYDPVYPPMPPDDPNSHALMHCVDCKRGYPCWHAHGDLTDLENPSWRERLGEYVTITPEGRVLLSVESAMQLALMHSTRYQQQLETLYLSALDVSTERFRFDVQFFGGNDTTFQHVGRLTPGGGTNPGGAPRSETNTLSTDSDLLLRRRFSRAGELVVGFANSFVWQFAGPDTGTASSLLDFSLVQPLLRGAGQDVALEQLTIVERGLLANLRAFQRYREGFYADLAVGDVNVQGPQRRGGFFGGTGLTGFSGTGAGGLGGVGSSTGFGRGGFGGGGGGAGGGGAGAGAVGGGAGTLDGFIGLLQQMQELRNAQDSLVLQLRLLRQLEALQEEGSIGLTQVDISRQSIQTERAQLLQSQMSLQNSVDNFIASDLRLPPDLEVELDDRLIRKFQFLDVQTTTLQSAIASFVEQFGELPEVPEVEVLSRELDRVADLRRRSVAYFDMVRGDLEHLESRSEQRERTMSPDERELFRQARAQQANAFEEIHGRFDDAGPRFNQLREGLHPATRAETADGVVQMASELNSMVQELSLVQARARLESVSLEPVVLDSVEGLDIARANRLDWKNNRAALVDSWRLVTFNADDLQSDLDIVFSGGLGTVGNNPMNFRGPTGNLRVGLQFDAPFTRLLERNNFRQSLIDYHQDRRQLIRFEDTVHQTLRALLRLLEFNEVNLEYQREAVVIAIRRVDQSREALGAPSPPAQPGTTVAAFSDTLARDMVDALTALRGAQNNFMSVWLRHYATRMQLMLELGIMQLDERGLWIDRPLGEYEQVGPAEAYIPPPVPAAVLEQIELMGPVNDNGQRTPPPDELGERPIEGSRADDGGEDYVAESSRRAPDSGRGNIVTVNSRRLRVRPVAQH